MNQRKATPANGTRFNASAVVLVLVVSHVPDCSGSAGMDCRSSQKIANITREKTIPAIAADFGVLRRARVRVPCSGIAIAPYCFGTVVGSELRLNAHDAFSV